jgi:hypothetical protein
MDGWMSSGAAAVPFIQKHVLALNKVSVVCGAILMPIPYWPGADPFNCTVLTIPWE